MPKNKDFFAAALHQLLLTVARLDYDFKESRH
jgi:hypothetical protein